MRWQHLLAYGGGGSLVLSNPTSTGGLRSSDLDECEIMNWPASCGTVVYWFQIAERSTGSQRGSY